MALLMLLYAVVIPCKLLLHVRATNKKSCKSNIQCQNCKVFMLFIFLFLAIVIFNVIFTKHFVKLYFCNS